MELVEDWEDSSRGIVGLDLGNTFVDCEFNIIKSFPKPDVQSKPYIPTSVVREKLLAIQKEVREKQKAYVQILERLKRQIERKDKEKQTNTEVAFADFKALSQKCISYYKSNFLEAQTKLEEMKNIEQTLRLRIEKLEKEKDNLTSLPKTINNEPPNKMEPVSDNITESFEKEKVNQVKKDETGLSIANLETVNEIPASLRNDLRGENTNTDLLDLQEKFRIFEAKHRNLQKLLFRENMEAMEKFASLEDSINEMRKEFSSKKAIIEREKQRIRDWAEEFSSNQGRKAEKEDLKVAKPMYDNLKKHETELESLHKRIVSLKDEQKKLVVESTSESKDNDSENEIPILKEETKKETVVSAESTQSKSYSTKEATEKVTFKSNDVQSKFYADKIRKLESKIKESEIKLRESRTKSARLEKELQQANKQTISAASGIGDESAKMKKNIDNMKKLHGKEMTEMQKKHEIERKQLQKKIAEVGKELDTTKAELAEAMRDKKILEDENKKAKAMNEEIMELRTKVDSLKDASKAVKEMEKRISEIETLYQEEQSLRRKYFNEIEDMKGKIRVYSRCRPMAKYEIEKNSKEVVSYPDEATVEIKPKNGNAKTFVYDRCFPSTSTQEDVFKETRPLIYSSLDGYNVCVFAYGQTGSGKTFTMVGSEDMPGLVRRTIYELFEYREINKNKKELCIKLYMVELYQDNLYDLLPNDAGKDQRKLQKAEKLEIKKDRGGTVYVKGAQVIQVNSARELINVFMKANAGRKTAATKMNSGSSRSHLVFSLLLENKDLTTRKVCRGKISLIDLAGSERSDKTGATGERIKEANSINKSLSALADVISALSNQEKFIPYRNNKLTQLMSDSLGGNAKTLMFVNISPADYNEDETLNSLMYASRVKLIKNSAEIQNESEEVNKLKRIIAELKENGGTSKLLDEYEGTQSKSATRAEAIGQD